MWINYPAIRKYDENNLLEDVLAHTSETYNSSDKIECAHELTHSINNTICNSSPANDNAFYCLRSVACLIEEPKISLRDVASIVPRSQRANTTYNLYLVQASQNWNNQPLYILDEWVAYSNGGEVGNYLLSQNKGGEQAAHQWACCLEFFPYIMALAMQIERKQPDYPGKDLKEFLQWNWHRVTSGCNINDSLQPESVGRRSEIMNNYLTAADNIELRNFAKQYFSEWLPDFGTGTFL